MEYKAKSCSTCGSEELKLVSHNMVEDNVFYTYHCLACGETFSTETAFHKRQEKLEKQAKKQEPISCNATEVGNDNSQSLSATEVYKKCREFVVEIKSEYDNSYSQGTGIILGNGYILSNAHVVCQKRNGAVEASNNITCRLGNDSIEEIDLMYADIKKDLALLYSEKKHNGAIFNNKGVETGEKVYAIGNSKGQGICMLDGIVSDRERIIDDKKFIMYSAPTVCGNSGGPLFDSRGEVIGVTTLGTKDATAMNFAIPVKIIENFVHKANEKEDLDAVIKRLE